MKIRRAAALVSLATLLPVTGMAQAPDPEKLKKDELQEQVQQQEQRLKVLERKLELQDEAARAAAATAAVVRASATRFSIQSADGASSVRVRGTLHFDGRTFGGEGVPETADTWLLRRVRPTIEGTLGGGIFDYRFTPDFSGGRSIILDAYVAARFKPSLVVTAGKFKVPVGLERIVSSSDLRFIERGFPTSLVPNRDLGVQLSGDFAGGAVSYSAGYFNGVTDGGSSDSGTPADAETDTAGDYAARIFFQPFINGDEFNLRGLGFGLGATWVDSTGSGTSTLLPGYRTPGQQTFFSYRGNTAVGATPANATFAAGERLRLAPQLHYCRGSFGVLGEYTTVRQDVARVIGTTVVAGELEHRAWQAQFSWFVTGEEQALRGFTPGSTFNVGKTGWGALELVARYHELDIDDAAFAGGADSFANPATAASKAASFGVGVNWYPHNAIKLSLGYDQTRFEGGAAAGDRPDEKALFTRFAVNF